MHDAVTSEVDQQFIITGGAFFVVEIVPDELCSVVAVESHVYVPGVGIGFVEHGVFFVALRVAGHDVARCGRRDKVQCDFSCGGSVGDIGFNGRVAGASGRYAVVGDVYLGVVIVAHFVCRLTVDKIVAGFVADDTAYFVSCSGFENGGVAYAYID